MMVYSGTSEELFNGIITAKVLRQITNYGRNIFLRHWSLIQRYHILHAGVPVGLALLLC